MEDYILPTKWSRLTAVTAQAVLPARVFDNKIKINIVLGFEKPIFFCQFCIFLLHVTYRYCIMLMKNIFAQITVKERT